MSVESKSKTATAYTPRLKKLYTDKYVTELQKELKLANVHEVPRLEKVIVNIGLGKAKDDKKMFEVAENTLLKVTGQKPQPTYARMSIATFKLREGNKIGMKVTLRGDRMYEFLDRFINIVLPRLRDFHGVSAKAFDQQGNYSIGLREQSIFPELSFEETTTAHGMQVIIVTDSSKVENNKELLVKLGMPFEKSKDAPKEKELK
ncbi:MAG TPA: 50S ribosomal protein L5 [Patescibacteria group bacterium]|nr:50S ribosomal protein L5 [Patescibacteria group bacterium]